MDEGIQTTSVQSPRDETIINIVTGMISTLTFTPLQYHPGDCRQMAAAVVTQIRKWDSPEASEGPPGGLAHESTDRR